jgi:hypothetical protein
VGRGDSERERKGRKMISLFINYASAIIIIIIVGLLGVFG